MVNARIIFGVLDVQPRLGWLAEALPFIISRLLLADESRRLRNRKKPSARKSARGVGSTIGPFLAVSTPYFANEASF